jgi:fructose-specific component phosphotransferase system IIB-like protein
MTPYRLLEHLLALEQRVRQFYVLLSQHQQFPEDLHAVWKAMAEDETHHIVALERSAHLFSVMESPPSISDQALDEVEVIISTAEAAVQQPTLVSDEALHQALQIEGSELNRIDAVWLHSFRPTTSLLLDTLAPATTPHIRRLVDAVHRFSTNTALHEEAETLWAHYDKAKYGTPPVGSPS